MIRALGPAGHSGLTGQAARAVPLPVGYGAVPSSSAAWTVST